MHDDWLLSRMPPSYRRVFGYLRQHCFPAGFVTARGSGVIAKALAMVDRTVRRAVVWLWRHRLIECGQWVWQRGRSPVYVTQVPTDWQARYLGVLREEIPKRRGLPTLKLQRAVTYECGAFQDREYRSPEGKFGVERWFKPAASQQKKTADGPSGQQVSAPKARAGGVARLSSLSGSSGSSGSAGGLGSPARKPPRGFPPRQPGGKRKIVGAWW